MRPWNLPLGLALAGGGLIAAGAIGWALTRPHVEPPPTPPRGPVEVPCEPPGQVGTTGASGGTFADLGVARGPRSAVDPGPDGGPRADDEDAGADANGDANGEVGEDAIADGAEDAIADGAEDAAADGAEDAAPAPGAAAETGGGYSPYRGGAPSLNDPFLYPVYGAPPPENPSGPPVVAGDEGTETTPLWIGPSGPTTNPGVVAPKPAIAPSVLVPFRDVTGPLNLWTSISPFLRPGDVVVARVTDASSLSALAPFATRARVDAPLVTYVLAFDRAADLDAATKKGLPETAGAAGLASLAGVDDRTLDALATKVHAQEKRFFVSTTLPIPKGGPSLAALARQADFVELEVPGEDARAAATTALPAVRALRSVRAPQIFLKLPADALTTTARLAGRSTEMVQEIVPDVGIALPWTTAIDRRLSDLRATPPPP